MSASAIPSTVPATDPLSAGTTSATMRVIRSRAKSSTARVLPADIAQCPQRGTGQIVVRVAQLPAASRGQLEPFGGTAAAALTVSRRRRLDIPRGRQRVQVSAHPAALIPSRSAISPAVSGPSSTSSDTTAARVCRRARLVRPGRSSLPERPDLRLRRRRASFTGTSVVAHGFQHKCVVIDSRLPARVALPDRSRLSTAKPTRVLAVHATHPRSRRRPGHGPGARQWLTWSAPRTSATRCRYHRRLRQDARQAPRRRTRGRAAQRTGKSSAGPHQDLRCHRIDPVAHRIAGHRSDPGAAKSCRRYPRAVTRRGCGVHHRRSPSPAPSCSCWRGC